MHLVTDHTQPKHQHCRSDAKVATADQRPQALCLCPTRELAKQIAEEVLKMGKYLLQAGPAPEPGPAAHVWGAWFAPRADTCHAQLVPCRARAVCRRTRWL